MPFKNNILVLFLFTELFSSCRKEEIAVKPADRGDIQTAAVDMGADYKMQLFFSLSEHAVISSNLKTDWDLAFECGDAGSKIKTNSSKSMNVYNTGRNAFNLVMDTNGVGANRKYEMPTGNLDSTAFGDWKPVREVYIVDRGFNAAGIPLGFKKIQIITVSAAGYKIKVANLNDADGVEISVAKNDAKNFVYISFTSNTVVNIEPDKENYDLLFSQFTHIYFDPFQPYLVTGVLMNPNKVKVAPVNDKVFADIVVTDTLSHPLKSFQNTIGFDWKTYNFITSTYVVDAAKCFIVKDTKGFLYKLHFIDFYSSGGLKGSPKLEYQRL